MIFLSDGDTMKCFRQILSLTAALCLFCLSGTLPVSAAEAETAAPLEIHEQYSANAKYVTVAFGSTTVRAGAGDSYPALGNALRGHTFLSIDEAKGEDGQSWYKVQYTDYIAGWISSDASTVTTAKKVGAISPAALTVNRVSQVYGAVGVQVAVIENGRVTDTYEYGYATAKKIPMTADHKVRAASISKVAVGMAAVKMQEEGIVDLDADIGEYWGVTPYHSTTLYDLLTHTSYFKGNYSKTTQKAIAAQIEASSSYRATDDWYYNNFGIGIAGATLEMAADETLNDYMKREFFAPLGIDAAFTAGDIDNLELLAALYYSNDTLARSVSTAKTMTGRGAGANCSQFAGGLTISAKDMAKLTAILANDGVYEGTRYLSKESVKCMETQACDAFARGHDFKQCLPLRYQTDIYGQNELYYHLGTAYGTLSYIGYNPNTKNGLVIITTGADAGYDRRGVWNICANMAQYFVS